MNQNEEKLIHALLRPMNPTGIVILGIYTVVWGLWVANPFWEVFTQAQLYGVLSMIAPEVFWGLLAIVCGLVTIYGSMKRRYRPLIVGSATLCWHWLMIAILYFLGDPLNTGGITCLALAICGAYVYLNVKINCKNNEIDDCSLLE